MVKVKICGITNHEDAAMAVGLGADAIGFIFADSARRVGPQEARDMICALPPFVKTVGVFVNEDPAFIKDIIHLCGLDMVQLHGDESPDVCGDLMPYAIKAFRIKDEFSLSVMRPYRNQVRAILLDTFVEGRHGGTGKTFDWKLAIMGKEQLEAPLILSGGLSPSNIEKAISTVRPYAVDVSSGIEDRPGIKSPVLMKEFMEIVRRSPHHAV